MSELFSHSRLKCFENCPKQFHFRYVLQLPQETESIEAFVGKRVHEVLERLYLFVGQDMLPALPQVLQRYELAWEAEYDPERVRIVKEGTPLSFYRALGARCLEGYYRRHYPFDGDETLGVEERVVFDLDPDGDPGRYRVQGIVDRISRSRDGAIEIIDYKTGGYVPTQEALDRDRQLALYQLGLSRRFGERPVRLVWHYLARGTVRRSSRTPEQLDALRRETVERIDRIRSEEDYAPKKSALCDWCEYRGQCPAWPGTGSARPAAPPPRRRDRQPPPSGPEQLALL